MIHLVDSTNSRDKQTLISIKEAVLRDNLGVYKEGYLILKSDIMVSILHSIVSDKMNAEIAFMMNPFYSKYLSMYDIVCIKIENNE